MFDVKPVNSDGSLNLAKIKKLRRMVTLPDKKIYKKIFQQINIVCAWLMSSGQKLFAESRDAINRVSMGEKRS